MGDRATARVVGSLFIAATVAGVLAGVFQQAVVNEPDYLMQMTLHEGRVATGALLELLMGVAVVGIVIAIYPVLRRYSERFALGYVVARTIEGVLYGVSAIALLTLLTVSGDFVEAGASEASRLQTLGATVAAARDWGNATVLVFAFTLSALILNWVLYRARLVPRWLSVWGLVATPLFLAEGVWVLYGLDPFSTTQTLMDLPLAVQEMTLALWLIFKGFAAPTVVPEPEGRSPRERVAVGG
ncbi:MAG TPA: DUF4386 domain-containing protein [Actinomycetota bacterium]|nr:DUF4386 domain-containing protein [Actinomycetota bacterium]